MGYVFAGIAVLLWGLVQIPIRLAKARGRVGVMLSLPVGTVVLGIILAFQGRLVLPDASLGEWCTIVWTGVVGLSIGTFAYFEAVKRAGLTNAAPVTRLCPVLIVIVAVILGMSDFSVLLAVAAVMVVAGSFVLGRGAHRAHPVELHAELRSGMVYGFVASIAWAAAALGVNSLPDSILLSHVTFYGLVAATVVHWSMMFALGRAGEIRRLRRLDVLLYSIQGVASFALGYWAYYESIRLLDVSEAAIIGGCWPSLGVIVGIVIFHEPMNKMKLAGMLLFLASAVLATI